MKPHNDKAGADLSFTVPEGTRLLDYLFAVLSDKSRTTVKSYLTHRQVYVNDRVTTRYDLPLRAGDRVTVRRKRGYDLCESPLLNIVYEDDYLIVADKKYGLLSVATDKTGEKTAYRILSEHVKKEDPRNKIFVVHRLDRETSGLMLFAKDEKTQETLQRNWEEAVIERTYVAVVEGVPQPESGTVRSYLAESSAFKVYPSTPEKGKLAVTDYRLLRSGGEYALLELSLKTGRKNQIRVHMQQIGHSVAGDRKYGGRSCSINRVALHARRLGFVHPATGKVLSFDTGIPKKFNLLLKQGAAQK